MNIDFRPQTYLLIVAALIMLATPFLTSWEKHSADKIEHVILNGFSLTHSRTDATKGEVIIEQENKIGILGSCLVAAFLSGYIITQSRNRIKQMKLGIGNSLAMMAALMWIIFASSEGERWLDPMKFGDKAIGFYLPFLALFLNMVSNRLIRRDENTVRNMNRMR